MDWVIALIVVAVVGIMVGVVFKENIRKKGLGSEKKIKEFSLGIKETYRLFLKIMEEEEIRILKKDWNTKTIRGIKEKGVFDCFLEEIEGGKTKITIQYSPAERSLIEDLLFKLEDRKTMS
jgi:hypothetical protein